MKIEGAYSTINLRELKELKLWASYVPEKYNEKADLNFINEQKIKDNKILDCINKLEVFLSPIISDEDKEEDKVTLGALEEKDYNYLASLMKSLTRLNIGAYWYKFSEEELNYCMNFVKKCTLENSSEIKKEVLEIPNYFLKCYAYYLLLHHPESNYKFSHANIAKHINLVSENLAEDMKKVEQQEINSWETTRNRY